MKSNFILKSAALGAMAAAALAAPLDFSKKRDATTDRLLACFTGLFLTGSWPGSCQAAVAVDMGLIKAIALNQMSMDFTPADPWTPTTSSSSVVATMLSLPGISLPITSVRQHIIVTDSAGVQLGNIETPWSKATVSGSTLTTSFTTSPFSVFSSSHDAFAGFVGALSANSSYTMTLQGSVDAKLNLGLLGTMTINGIGFKTPVTLSGLNGLSQTKYIYLIDTNFDDVNYIRMTTIINIVNPSKLSLTLGDVAFSTATSEGFVGVSRIKSLVLVPGNNYVMSTTDLDMSIPASTNFLVNLSTADGVLTLTGFNGSSTDPVLNAGLASLTTNLVVPANFAGSVMSQPPYKDWSLKILSTTGTDYLAEVTATFQSPYYGFPVTMVGAAEPGNDNNAYITGASSTTNMMRLFTIQNNFVFDVSGTGSATVTFKVKLPGPFLFRNKAKWQELVNYGQSNGYLPVNFNWMAKVIVNNDGVNRFVDWGNTGTGLGNVHVAVGSDFASILNAFPAA